MGFIENIFPLLVIYVIWKVIDKAQRSVSGDDSGGEKSAPEAVAVGQGMNTPVNITDLLRVLFQKDGQSPVGDPSVKTMRKESGGTPPAQIVGKKPLLQQKKREIEEGRPPAATKVFLAAGAKKAPLSGIVPSRRRILQAKDLRRAVVWSEILSKPVSLRD